MMTAAQNEIFVGESPSGVLWVVYPREGETADSIARRVAEQRVRLAALHAKRAAALRTPAAVEPVPAAVVTAPTPANEPKDEMTRLVRAYELARQAYFKSRTAVARKRVSEPDHWKVSERLKAARVALRKAQRAAAKRAQG